MPHNSARFQAQFHRRWKHLNDPHVRSLAWLLDAPDLLDPQAPQWRGKIASLGAIGPQIEEWLSTLDKSPDPLQAYLQNQPFTRLGRYAEKLMAFYFEQRQMLVAHGLQVRDANGTIGEFDFLLQQDGLLLHWEFASKFYLLEEAGTVEGADQFVGPNLADTLGAKVRKIMDRQLNLSQHPAAQQYLPRPVAQAQALVKGWLFYRGQTPEPVAMHGVSMPHCRGFWTPLGAVNTLAGERFVVLPRLSWLAPAKVVADLSLNKDRLVAQLREHFRHDAMPVLVAILEQHDDTCIEVDRGFIVPDDWSQRAEERARKALIAG